MTRGSPSRHLKRPSKSVGLENPYLWGHIKAWESSNPTSRAMPKLKGRTAQVEGPPQIIQVHKPKARLGTPTAGHGPFS